MIMGEKWYLMGYRKVDFVDDKTNKRVQGYSLFLSRDITGVNGRGQECQKQFISSAYVDYDPIVGDEVMISFNRYGKVAAVTSC